MFPKSLPYINFFLATSSLGFQLMVLYPWHHTLDEAFTELRSSSQKSLDEHINHHDRQLTDIESHLQGLLGGLRIAGLKESVPTPPTSTTPKPSAVLSALKSGL